MRLPRFISERTRKGENPASNAGRHFDDLSQILGKWADLLEEGFVDLAKLQREQAASIQPAILGKGKVYDVRSFASLAKAVSHIGSDTATLYITKLVTISSATTIPSNISVVRLEGGGFTSSNASSLTINGSFSSPPSRAFFGDLVVAFSNPVRVMPVWWGADLSGVTDMLAAGQAAHDSLPAAGGEIFFSDGTYIITGSDRYINVSKDDVQIKFASGAKLISENSSDPDTASGGAFNVGFRVTGDRCLFDGVAIRGGLIIWNPSDYHHRLTVRNSRFWNLHNAAISLNTSAIFSQLVVENSDFDTNLATDSGNYASIQRGDNVSSVTCGQAVITGCRFRASGSGGVNLHRLEQLVLRNCRFEGCHYFAFKVSASFPSGNQDVLVDGCYFDGTAIDTGSANRHRAIDDVTVPGYSDSLGFIQVFQNVQFKNCTAVNFPRLTLDFLDGSFLNANIEITENNFTDCVEAIYNPQGTVRIAGNTFTRSSVRLNGSLNLRAREEVFEQNHLVDSKLYIGATAYAQYQNRIRIYQNQVEYTLDNTGAIEVAEMSGTTYTPIILLEENYLSVSGGSGAYVKGIALSGGSLPTCAFRKGNVLVGSTTIDSGVTEYLHSVYDRTGGPDTYTIAETPEITGIPFVDWILLNTNATGENTYVITDTAHKVGTRLYLFRTNATYRFNIAISGGGTVNGWSSLRANTQYSGGTLVKAATGVWRLENMTGEWQEPGGTVFVVNGITRQSGADQAAVTLGNENGEIGGLTISAAYDQAEIQALRDKCEELADDVRALSTLIHAMRTAGVNVGWLKGSA